MFHHLLVPLDGSPRAELALPVAARIAHATGATLTLLRVVSLPRDMVWQSMGGPFINISEVFQQEQARADEYVQHIAALAMLEDLHVEAMAIEGNVSQRILTEAQTNQADLIVMCSRGETGLKRWAYGSVSLQVVRQSSIPVLLLHPEADEKVALMHTLPQRVRVLVPLDGSAFAEEALAPAMALIESLSAPEQGWLHLTGVVPLFTTEMMIPDKVHDAMKTGQEYLAMVERRLLRQAANTNAHLTVTTSVALHQDVAHALVDLAEVGTGLPERADGPGCDIVAMATHGRSGLAHWVMGSVTERVMDGTRLPLLIVRPQQAAVAVPAKHKERELDTASWAGLL